MADNTVVLEREGGGYVSADLSDEYDNLKKLASVIVLALQRFFEEGSGISRSEFIEEFLVCVGPNLRMTMYDLWETATAKPL